MPFSDNYVKVCKAIQTMGYLGLPTIQGCVEKCHQNHQPKMQGCQSPNKCPTKKKPSKPVSCQPCIDWGKVIEAECYPPGKGIQWKNVNSTLLHKDPVEVAKGFVFIIPSGQNCTDFSDFDIGGILKLMMGFKDYHGGDQDCYDKIQKVLNIRNGLSHMKIQDNMYISDKQLDVYFNDIDECIDAISGHQQILKADKIKDCIKQIRQSGVTTDMIEGALAELSDGLKLALEDAKATQTEQLEQFVKIQMQEQTKEVVAAVADGTEKVSTTIANGTKEVVAAVADNTQKVSTNVADGTKEVVAAVADNTQKVSTNVADGTKEVVAAVADNTQKVSTTVADGTREVVAAVADNTQKVSTNVADGTQEVVAAVADNTQKVSTNVADGTQEVVAAVADNTQKVSTNVADGTKEVVAAVADNTQKVSTTIADGTQKVVDKLDIIHREINKLSTQNTHVNQGNTEHSTGTGPVRVELHQPPAEEQPNNTALGGVDNEELEKWKLIEGNKIATSSFSQVLEVTFKSGNCRGHRKGALKKVNIINQEEIEDIWERVKHPYIVTLLGCVMDMYEDNFTSYLVMELADQNLKQYLNDHKGNIPTADLENWARQACGAIAYLHRGVEMPDGQMKQIILRDIKASNCLLFLKNGALLLKVADCGILRGINHTKAGTKLEKGTLPWIAPEIREAIEANDAKVDALFSCESDIFGLGLMFWEMFTQESPKEQTSDDPNTWKIPQEPVYLMHLLPSCWENNPDQRPGIKQVMEYLPSADVVDASEFYQLQEEDMNKVGVIKSGSFGDVVEFTFKKGSFRGQERAAVKPLNRLEPQDIEIMNCASHNHIVKLLAYIPGRNPLLVMELANRSLWEYLNGSRTSIQEPPLEEWVRDACMAIDHLHDGVERFDGIKRPIVHCDIKASNCLLFDRTLKVSDFGILKATDDTTGQGSLPLKAPELSETPPRFSVASDVYSMGVLIYDIYKQPGTQDTLEPNLEPKQFSVPASFPGHLKILLPKCWENEKKRCTIKNVLYCAKRLCTDSA